RQSLTDGKLHPHPGVGDDAVVDAMYSGGILAQRKLDYPWGALEEQFFRIKRSIAQFHDHTLPTDCICRSMQRLDSGYAARQCAVDGDVQWVKGIAHPKFSRNWT